MKSYSVELLITSKHKIQIDGIDADDAMQNAQREARNGAETEFIKTVEVEATGVEECVPEKERD